MKFVSIVFTLLLLIPLGACLTAILQIYNESDTNPIPGKLFYSVAGPVIFYAFSYVVFLIFSVFLNVNKRYITNTLLIICLFFVYLMTIHLIRNAWVN
jgi:hypothetical protein